MRRSNLSKGSRRARPGNQPASQRVPARRPARQRLRPAVGHHRVGRHRSGRQSDGATTSTAASAVEHPAAAPAAGSAPAGRRRSRSSSATAVLIVGAVGVAALALVTVCVFSSASAAAFTCSTEWVPDPTASPAAGASPQPGYVQPDMGNTHVGAGTSTRRRDLHVLPAGQRQPFQRAAARSPRGLYGPNDVAAPAGLDPQPRARRARHPVSRRPGEEGDRRGPAAAAGVLRGIPPSPVCGFPPSQEAAGAVIARFDDMATPYAALVWGRVLPLETFDRRPSWTSGRRGASRPTRRSSARRPRRRRRARVREPELSRPCAASATGTRPPTAVIVAGGSSTLDESLTSSRRNHEPVRLPASRRRRPSRDPARSSRRPELPRPCRRAGPPGPDRPMLFAKFANAIVADGAPIVRPRGTHALDLEVELGVVIGRLARGSRASAMDSRRLRRLQRRQRPRLAGQQACPRAGERGDGQWLRAKGSDTFLPMGPSS